jgi:hypothetical protein
MEENRSALEASGDLFVAAVYPLFRQRTRGGRRRYCRLSRLLFCLLPVLTATAAYAQEAQPLTSARTRNARWSGREPCLYDHFARRGRRPGEADQHGADLVIDIFGPDGKLIRTVDSPNGAEGPEPIDLTAFRRALQTGDPRSTRRPCQANT